MDLRTLKLFIAVAEELNFRIAAKKMGMTQPPLTRAISSLEDELQVKLFDRNTRKVDLTAAGVALLAESKEVIEKVNTIRKSIKNYSDLEKQDLRIAISPLALHSNAVKAVWKFKDYHPCCNIEFVEGSFQKSLKRLKNSEVDFAIVEDVESSAFNYEKLLLEQESLGLLLPKEHRFFHRKKVKIQELDGETLIVHDKKESKSFVHLIQLLFKKHDASLEYFYRREDESCSVLVANNKGILLTTESMSKFALEGLKYVPLDYAIAKMSIHACWLGGDERPVKRLFRDFLKNESYIRTPKSPCLVSLANW